MAADAPPPGWRDEVDELLVELETAIEDYLAHDDEGQRYSLLDQAFRSAHSCKGLLRVAGLETAADTAHDLEELLTGLRSGKLTPQPLIQQLLLDGQEILRQLLEQPQLSKDTDFGVRVRQLLDSHPSVAPDLLPHLIHLPPVLGQCLTAVERQRLVHLRQQQVELFELRWRAPGESWTDDLGELLRILAQQGEVIATVPDLDSDGAMRFHFLFAGETEGLPEVEVVPLQPAPATQPITPPAQAKTLRLEVERLDRLLDTVGELLWLRGDFSQLYQRLRQHCPPEDRQAFRQMVRRLERTLSRLRRETVDLRMVAIRPLFERMRQVVRRAALDRGKVVRLELDDGEVRLDKRLAEELSDPLMHLVRNAVDHGLEPPLRRRELGKPEEGVVRLTARRQGQQILVRVEDDGQGIDLEALYRKAVALGRVEPETALTDDARLALAFLPGVSSRESADLGAGRGVGLDAVQERLARISGRVRAETQRGVGSSFSLSLPATLTLLSGLLCRCGEWTFVLPASAVRKLQVAHEGHGKVPLVPLEALFGAAVPVGSHDRALEIVMGEERALLPVDEVIGQVEVLVRSPGPLLELLPGLSGIAICGDQQLEALLDPAILLRLAAGGTLLPPPSSPAPVAEVATNALRLPWLVFTVAGAASALALPVERLIEIVRRPSLLRWPGAPTPLAGVMLYRGEVLPVVELPTTSESGKSLDKSGGGIIVFQLSHLRIGVWAHSILRLGTIDGCPEAVAFPSAAEIAADIIDGVVRGSDYDVYLVESNRLLRYLYDTFAAVGGPGGQEKGADRRG